MVDERIHTTPTRGWLLAGLLAGLLAAVAAMACGWLTSSPSADASPASSAPRAALASTSMPLSARPSGFWRTAGQALAIAKRQPTTRRLLARYPGMAVAVFPGLGGERVLGVWSVRYFPPASRGTAAGSLIGQAGEQVLIADRTGTVLETSPWAWPAPWETGNAAPTWRARVEVISLLLGALLLVLLWDAGQPFAARNLDLLALLSLGVSLAFFDRGHVLVSVPLQYPPLVYLAARLVWVGARRRASPGQAGPAPAAAWANPRVLWAALAALVVARVLFNLLLGTTGDVAYASVLGANGIHHGLPLYWTGGNHLDAYGPAMYLSYVPFEFLFPDPGWVWNWLPAAHAAAIAFDLLTMAGLVLLGRRLSRGRSDGLRLGAVLALGWATNPWTFEPLATSSNDGLVALLLVGLMLAASSPLVRGSVLGWAVAAKFAPLALAGLFCFSTDRERRPRAVVAFGCALVGVTAVLIWAFLPAQGISLFWARTLGFQFARHSFMAIWDQYPVLEPLRVLVEGAVAVLAAALLVWPRRRELYQVAAFAGALVVGLELSVRFWSYQYMDWFMPALLVALLGAPVLAPVREEARARLRYRVAAA